MKLLCVDYSLKIHLLKGEIMVVDQEDTELNILQQRHQKYIYMWSDLLKTNWRPVERLFYNKPVKKDPHRVW